MTDAPKRRGCHEAPERILAWVFGGRLRIAPIEHGPLEFATEYVRADPISDAEDEK